MKSRPAALVANLASPALDRAQITAMMHPELMTRDLHRGVSRKEEG
jgi:hypothetical protein